MSNVTLKELKNSVGKKVSIRASNGQYIFGIVEQLNDGVIIFWDANGKRIENYNGYYCNVEKRSIESEDLDYFNNLCLSIIG